MQSLENASAFSRGFALPLYWTTAPSSQNRFNILSSRPTKRHPLFGGCLFVLPNGLHLRPRVPKVVRDEVASPTTADGGNREGVALCRGRNAAKRTASRRISGTANGSRCAKPVKRQSRFEGLIHHPAASNKKDVFAVFAYEFELLQKMKSLLTQG